MIRCTFERAIQAAHGAAARTFEGCVAACKHMPSGAYYAMRDASHIATIPFTADAIACARALRALDLMLRSMILRHIDVYFTILRHSHTLRDASMMSPRLYACLAVASLTDDDYFSRQCLSPPRFDAAMLLLR